MHRSFHLAPLFLFLSIALYFAVGLTRDPRTLPSALLDRPVPTFDLAPIQAADNGLASTDLLGKAVLVNFFASWCSACQVEHPLLMRLAAEGAIPIYGIDWKDDPRDGAAWLKRFGNPYTRVGDDSSGRLGIDLGVAGVPETFVVDKTGRIRYRHIGPITEEVWEESLRSLVVQVGEEP